jgi:hypothetical protein
MEHMTTFRIPVGRWVRCQPTITVTIHPAFRRRVITIFVLVVALSILAGLYLLFRTLR